MKMILKNRKLFLCNHKSIFQSYLFFFINYRTNNDNLEFHKSERRKKQKQRLNGHRKRTSSSETLIVEDIPPPQPTERSRSVEIIRGIDRVDFERSKTENLLTSADTSSIDTSNSYGLSANSKLMTQSLGRGQSIPSVSQAIGRESLHSNISNSQDAPPPDRLLDPLSTLQSDEASIQEYIGQTFPLVKNIDKDVVASSVAISNSVERRHSSSQPLPSQVASITRSNFHSYMQPPLSNNSGVNLDDTGMEKIPSSVGKKSRSSQKRQQPNLNGVALASLDSTPNKIKESDITQQRIAQQNFTTPPRKPMDVSQPSLLASSSTAHKEKPSHNRIIDKISLSGSNYSSRSSSPLTKSSILHIDEENKPGSTVQNAAETLQTLYKSQSTSEDKGTDKEDQFAQGNDRILREKLQEAKAMNRQETTNGAVMYQFSLWKGVQKRDPIPDISLPKRIVNNSESTDQTPIKSTKKDQVKTSSQKKSNRLRGPRAAIEAQDENIAEHSTKVDHIGNVQTTQRKLTEKKSEDNIEKKEAQSHHPTPIYPELPVTRQSEFGVRQVMSKSSKDCSEDEKSNDEEESFEHHLSGRAFAFRNMVGSCKSSNLSCGSLAETVQTEIGIPNMYTGDVVDTALSVDSLSTVDSDHDENLSVEDDAILAVAMENEYSFISNDHEEVDHISQSAGNEHVFQPNFSLELSLEAISQSADQSVEPPVIKKREKSQTLGFDEHNSNANVKNVLVSASLSKLPTHNGSTSSTHPVRRKSATSGHTQRIREMTIAAKLESPYDEQIDIFQDSQKTENSSPSLLSEASEYDTFEDSHITKNDQTITTTDDQNILSQQHQYNRSLISPEVFSSNRSAVQFQNDEIYSIHDFQWKRGSEILGEGSFGQVFKGMNCSTGELLAIKQICLTDGTEEEVATLRQEIDLMDSLKHPNIVR